MNQIQSKKNQKGFSEKVRSLAVSWLISTGQKPHFR